LVVLAHQLSRFGFADLEAEGADSDFQLVLVDGPGVFGVKEIKSLFYFLALELSKSHFVFRHGLSLKLRRR